MANSNKINRFQMILAEGWVDQSVYIYNGPEDRGLQHNLTLVVDNVLQDDDLDLFAQERIDAFLDSTQGAELLKQEKRTLASGVEAVEAVIKWAPTEGKIIFQKRVYLVIDEVGYSFTANFTKQTIKTIGLQVDEMIGSFSPGS